MIVMRHCQSEFNEIFSRTRVDPGIADPSLTPDGLSQAHDAAQALQHATIKRILVSPYRRALQTAAPIARAHGIVPIVTPLVRERAYFSCDIGTPASSLARQWPEIDFSMLDDVWWEAGTEPEEATNRRADAFRASLDGVDHEHTLVVSHWAFLRALLGQSMANGTWQHFDPATPASHRAVSRASLTTL